jgi:hypothetical protein
VTIDLDRLVLAPCMAAWAVPVCYVTVDGERFDTVPPGLPLRGIFERATKDIRPDREGTLIDTAHPTLGIRMSELIAAGVDPERMPTEREVFEINGQQWRISNAPPPDSAGHIFYGLMITTSAAQ